MIGIDTNILLRFLIDDDAEHADELDILLAAQNGPVANAVDHLVAWAGFDAGCRKTMTFDRKAAKTIPGMELLA